MDSSRRAVESYWRSRMIDAATSDEDKVTPVYKLEEVCQLLRSSHVSVVKEVSQFILKRLEHKSAVVKQKALRLIKYAVGKSGVEFRREMQRHSVAVRQLFQYKGQPDPLKGDALNKAVRDAAHEAISIIFSADEQKPAPAEDLNKRIQGFGNTNFEMPSMDKRSFLSEVVGLGSSSIKQGLSSFIQDRALKMDGNGNYKGPNLRRSLTVEAEKSDRCQHVEHYSDVQPSFVVTSNGTTGTWNQDSKFQMDVDNGNSPSIDLASRTCEERLLETVVTSGGIRVQPSRDALQVFLVEAAKLDAVALSLALESKLQSPVWQVRMKALCVLESILRKKDEESFSVVATYFNENEDVVLSCSKSPQASLKEKANKVLSLLGGGKIANMKSHTENPAEADKSVLIEIPDLIDTSDPNNPQEIGDVTKNQSDENIAVATSAPPPLIDDLFGDGLDSVASASEQKSDDDPFADVSFHNNDLFSGMTIDDKAGAGADENGAELFDVFAPASEHLQEQGSYKKDARDVMAGLSINENALLVKQKEISSYDALKNIFASQNMEANENFMHPVGSTMPFNLPPGAMFNQALSPRPNIYAASSAGPFLSQQQFLEAMTSFQNLGNLNTHNASSHTAGMNRGPSSSLPDIFHQKIPAQTPSAVMMKGSKKEETKAFDFISDHLAAARDRKRMA